MPGRHDRNSHARLGVEPRTRSWTSRTGIDGVGVGSRSVHQMGDIGGLSASDSQRAGLLSL
jgi:hypothetical protein